MLTLALSFLLAIAPVDASHDSCGKHCRPAFTYCKSAVKTAVKRDRPFMVTKKEKRELKRWKKKQLRHCKKDKKCRQKECRQRGVCSPNGQPVTSPMDSFIECDRTTL